MAQSRPGDPIWTWISPRGPYRELLGPVCTDGSLIFTAGKGDTVKSGVVYALDLKTGVVVWETDISGEASRRGTICLAEKTLYVSTDRGDFYAIEASTGKSLWHSQMPFQSGMISISGNDIFVSAGGKLFAIDARNGKGDWWIKQGNSYMSNPPILLPGRLLVRDSTSIYCLNEQNRKVRWKAPASLTIDFTLHRNSFFACSSTSASLTCYDLARGSEKWTQKTKYRLKSSVVPCQDWVIICSSYDDCRLVGVEARNGEEAWTIQLPVVNSLYATRLVAGEDRVYLQFAEQLYCVDPGQGSIEWQAPLPGPQTMECLWKDRLLTLSQQRGTISCYAADTGVWSQYGGGAERGNYARETAP